MTYFKMLSIVIASAVAANTYAVDCGGLDNWASGSVYVGGNQIQYNGSAYQAKWWTTNEDPASSSVWLNLGQCDDGSTGGNPNTGNCAGLSVWNSTIAYGGGDYAIYDGVKYRANWWTQGDNPATQSGPTGSGLPWTMIEDCEGDTGGPGGPGENLSPTASVNGPYTAQVNTSVQFSSAGSSDPDGTIASYSWSFGDGTTSNAANPSHSYALAGTYTVSLTVTDDDGADSTATTYATITSIDTPPPSGDKKVIGYFTEWGVYGRDYHVKNLVTSGSADRLTHILYSFGNTTGGLCSVGDTYAAYDKAYSAADSVDGIADTWDTGALRGNFNQLRKLKAQYPNIKVIWSFGGWTWSGGFSAAAANPQAFAESCYNLVNDPRWAGVFDGIDIDWEYPNDCGLSCDNSGYDSYRNLMAALRARFGNQLVTSAITASASKMDSADYGGAAQYLDFFMVMTYDFFGAFAAAGPTAPHSPLYDYPGMSIAGFSSHTGIQKLKSLGVPSEKILLGIGFYGRGWTNVAQAAPGGSAGGAAPGTYEQGIEDYKVLKNTCPASGTIGGTAYAYCGGNWWGYDTPDTIAGKMNYVNQQDLGGAFFWEFSGDTADGELIRAISEGL